MPEGVVREELPGGEVRLLDAACTFTFLRLRPGAMLVKIAGHDRGQFGTRALDEVRLEILRNRPLELFVDAREAVAAATSVSAEWTRFFELNREHLRRVCVLVGSKVLYLTVAIAQHLSRTGNLIQILSDAEIFDAQLAGAAVSGPRPA
ncbi:MAG TPA: hypothetical protein VMH77_02265 [Steroidobacteraceae bacterium]|nr:hypothetical protein [Steroidobacteraceae bacterium]